MSEDIWPCSEARKQPDGTTLTIAGRVSRAWPPKKKTSRNGATWHETGFLLEDSTGNVFVVAADPPFPPTEGNMVQASGKVDTYMGTHTQTGQPELKHTLAVTKNGLTRTGAGIEPTVQSATEPFDPQRRNQPGDRTNRTGLLKSSTLVKTLSSQRRLQEALFNEWLEYNADMDHNAIARMINTLMISVGKGFIEDDISPRLAALEPPTETTGEPEFVAPWDEEHAR